MTDNEMLAIETRLKMAKEKQTKITILKAGIQKIHNSLVDDIRIYFNKVGNETNISTLSKTDVVLVTQHNHFPTLPNELRHLIINHLREKLKVLEDELAKL
jgi:hypothetical protein